MFDFGATLEVPYANGRGIAVTAETVGLGMTQPAELTVTLLPASGPESCA